MRRMAWIAVASVMAAVLVLTAEGWESNPQWSLTDQLLTYIDEQCVAFRCPIANRHLRRAPEPALATPSNGGAAADHMYGPLLWAPDGRSILDQAHIELSGLMDGPLVLTPLSGTPQVVTVEFGIVSYDWQPVPVR